jgi:hypothetical protein
MEKSGRILFVCGSIDQTVQMVEIANQLSDCDCRFTPYRGQALNGWFTQNGLAHKLATTKKLQGRCLNYMIEHQLALDTPDMAGDYDVVVSTPDLDLHKAIRLCRLVLVQNAMIDHDMVEEVRESAAGRLVHGIPFLARWLTHASSSAGDDSYDKLCVASEGYRDLFVRYGVDRSRIVVTGIPKLDNYASFIRNDFPYRDYALVVTSEEREAFQFESHRHFVQDALRIARGWQVLFRIPAGDKRQRIIDEVQEWAPSAKVFTDGEVGPMVANCSMLITQCPSVAFMGMALGKELHSYMNLAKAYVLLPLQNGGQSAANIARVCRPLLPAISRQKSALQISNGLRLPSYSI